MSWYEAKLADPDVAFYIAELDGSPVAYARVERLGPRSGEIAMSVDAPHRGRGLGSELAALAAERSAEQLGLRRILARVKSKNPGSVRAFERAGFARPSGVTHASEILIWGDAGPIVPHSRPFVGETEAEAGREAIASGHLAQGARVAELEESWATAVSMPAAVCVGSGVAALRLALRALGVGPGDEVLVPAYSCIALLNAPMSLGAVPVLVDVIEDDWTIDPEDASRRVTPRTRAAVGVNLFGAPMRLRELLALDVPVVEDCAHGIGGHTNAGPFGGGSAASISSFYATKMLSAGEGGVIAIRDPELTSQIQLAREYGDQLPDGAHLNDKMTDVEAGVALVQLRRLDEILSRREARAAAYEELLAPLVENGDIVLPSRKSGRIWYRYAVRLRRRSAPAVVRQLAALGVRGEQPVWDLRAAPHWTPGLDRTASAFESVVSLPLYPDLSPRELEFVVHALLKVLAER
jgi:perosamine synthetase